MTTTFGYTADRLTSYGGSAIGYNAMGCPTSYDGKITTWSKGKLSRLSGGTKIDGVASYGYNALGQRISRSYTCTADTSELGAVQIGQLTASSRKYYYDHAGRLIAENVSKTFYGGGSTSENIVFLYDEVGIIGMKLTTGGATNLYYFQRNLQGDVVAIYDANGTLKAKYLYDAWGNCTISSETTSYDVANANPIRYRGYYYDDDTGLYYCNARYYSPKWRRFISPNDSTYLDPESVNGLNLYCYCYNDPVNYVDPSGHMPKWLAWVISGAAMVGGIILCATGIGGIFGGVLIGAGAGSLINGYVNEANGGSFAAGYIGGAISGALCGIGAGLGGMALAAATEVTNFAMLGYLGLSAVSSFGFGFAGNLAGTVYTSWHNSGFKSVNVSWQETFTMSASTGTLNILAGIGSGVSSVAAEIGKTAVSISSKVALRILAGTIAGVTEALYDTTTYLLSKLIELL